MICIVTQLIKINKNSPTVKLFKKVEGGERDWRLVVPEGLIELFGIAT